MFTGNLFAFCNRLQDMVKILHRGSIGFCTWLKRLEEYRFRWPESEEVVVAISPTLLIRSLRGLDLRQPRRQLCYETVV